MEPDRTCKHNVAPEVTMEIDYDSDATYCEFIENSKFNDDNEDSCLSDNSESLISTSQCFYENKTHYYTSFNNFTQDTTFFAEGYELDKSRNSFLGNKITFTRHNELHKFVPYKIDEITDRSSILDNEEFKKRNLTDLEDSLFESNSVLSTQMPHDNVGKNLDKSMTVMETTKVTVNSSKDGDHFRATDFKKSSIPLKTRLNTCNPKVNPRNRIKGNSEQSRICYNLRSNSQSSQPTKMILRSTNNGCGSIIKGKDSGSQIRKISGNSKSSKIPKLKVIVENNKDNKSIQNTCKSKFFDKTRITQNDSEVIISGTNKRNVSQLRAEPETSNDNEMMNQKASKAKQGVLNESINTMTMSSASQAKKEIPKKAFSGEVNERKSSRRNNCQVKKGMLTDTIDVSSRNRRKTVAANHPLVQSITSGVSTTNVSHAQRKIPMESTGSVSQKSIYTKQGTPVIGGVITRQKTSQVKQGILDESVGSGLKERVNEEILIKPLGGMRKQEDSRAKTLSTVNRRKILKASQDSQEAPMDKSVLSNSDAFRVRRAQSKQGALAQAVETAERRPKDSEVGEMSSKKMGNASRAKKLTSVESVDNIISGRTVSKNNSRKGTKLVEVTNINPESCVTKIIDNYRKEIEATPELLKISQYVLPSFQYLQRSGNENSDRVESLHDNLCSIQEGSTGLSATKKKKGRPFKNRNKSNNKTQESEVSKVIPEISSENIKLKRKRKIPETLMNNNKRMAYTEVEHSEIVTQEIEWGKSQEIHPTPPQPKIARQKIMKNDQRAQLVKIGKPKKSRAMNEYRTRKSRQCKKKQNLKPVLKAADTDLEELTQKLQHNLKINEFGIEYSQDIRKEEERFFKYCNEYSNKINEMSHKQNEEVLELCDTFNNRLKLLDENKFGFKFPKSDLKPNYLKYRDGNTKPDYCGKVNVTFSKLDELWKVKKEVKNDVTNNEMINYANVLDLKSVIDNIKYVREEPNYYVPISSNQPLDQFPQNCFDDFEKWD